MFVSAEFGSVWGIALFHRHEEFNAKETTQKEGPKDKDNITEKHFKEDYVLAKYQILDTET